MDYNFSLASTGTNNGSRVYRKRSESGAVPKNRKKDSLGLDIRTGTQDTEWDYLCFYISTSTP